MIRRASLTLAVILVLFVSIVPQSLSQQFPELFDKLVYLFKQEPNMDLTPLMLNEIWPQGIAPLPNEAVDPAVAEHMYEELLRRTGLVIGLLEELVLDPTGTVPPEVADAALRAEAFVEYYETLIEMAAEGAIPLEPPAGAAGDQVQDVAIIRQFVNPLFITWWKPWPESPKEIEEKVFTAEIPIWGAAVVVKEVRGVKLELVRGLLPINPCWWWRLFGIPWNWNWYYFRLMPAEFIKTISYVNTWNAGAGRPEVIKDVEQDVIIDKDLMEFWWYLSDPQLAPAKEDETLEDETLLPSMKSSSIATRTTVRWGAIKSAE